MLGSFRRLRRSPRAHRSRHPVAQFQRAHAFWHFRAYERAIPILEDLILEHPAHPITELGGALLIDSLTVTKRLGQLTMWLDLLVHIEGFLADKPQLKAIVRDHRRRFCPADGARNENRDTASLPSTL